RRSTSRRRRPPASEVRAPPVKSATTCWRSRLEKGIGRRVPCVIATALRMAGGAVGKHVYRPTIRAVRWPGAPETRENTGERPERRQQGRGVVEQLLDVVPDGGL